MVLPGLNLHPHRLDPLSELLTNVGAATVVPRLTGFTVPGDPAQGRVRPQTWLADLDAAWAAAQARLPRARPSLLSFSMGGALGLAWALQAGVPLRRAILISPALRLRPLVHAALTGLCGLVPGPVSIPSGSPRAYRFHRATPVAAYRSLLGLQRLLAPHLGHWLAGDGAGLPPVLIAVSARDELVDTRPLLALARALPEQVTLMPLEHERRPGYLAHLGLDGPTLGESEWRRLSATLGEWLRRTDDAAPVAPTAPPAPYTPFGDPQS